MSTTDELADPCDQTSEIGVKSVRERKKGHKRWVSFTSFDSADVGPMETGDMGKLLLGDSGGHPQLTDTHRQLESRVLGHVSNHRRDDDDGRHSIVIMPSSRQGS
ncbi:MAG: hypothetical protein QOE83_1964 [Actinomycetota bacterium]|nr:hypothetical protein [Actinomycetota bacterium]